MNEAILTKAAETIERVATDTKSIAKKSDEHESRIAYLEQIAVRGSSSAPYNHGSRVLKELTDHPRFTELLKGAKSTGRIEINDVGVSMLRKDLFSLQSGASSVGIDVEAQRIDGFGEDPRRQLTLLDMLPRLRATSNTFEFLRMDGYLNNADAQATEGAAKPETDMPTSLSEVKINTYAHWIRCSTQVLMDMDQLATHLQGLLSYGVLAKMERDIIDGDGTGGRALGLVPQATPFVPSLGTDAGHADAIGAGIAELSALGWMPDLVVLNPRTWHRIRSERGTDLQYVAGGWAMPAQPSVYNVRVVTTPSLEDGKALILDTKQTAFLDRMMPVFAVSRDDGDNFTTNKATLLVEMRAGLAVFSPSAVLLVDLY